MRKRLVNSTLLAALVVAAVGVGAWWYFSPFLAVRDLQRAAQAGDADAFNAHVDYPRLRQSLKLQFSGLLAQKLGVSRDASNPMAALGGMIGERLIEPLVDALVRPETVMAAMQSGRLGATARGLAADPALGAPAIPARPEASAAPAPPETAPAPGTAATGPAAPAPADKPRWRIDRQGMSRMTAYAIDPARAQEPDADRLALVFERSGFVDWKLTDIRLPARATIRP
jgi:hypothetical protein